MSLYPCINSICYQYRSKRKNTMFPSVDAMFKEKKRVQEEEEINKLLSNAK